MVLQARDKKLLAALSRYGVLSTEQVAALFFSGISHTTVMKRLRKLEHANVVLRLRGLPNALSAWCLTAEGARAINANEPPRYSNQNAILHDVTLSGFRLSLEDVGLGYDWTSETEMRRQFQFRSTYYDKSEQIIPDGIFTASAKTAGVVAVELELNPKNHARYRKILSQYARKDSIKWLWYVVKTQGIGSTVMGQWLKTMRYPDSPTLIYSLLDETLSNPRHATIYFANGEKKILSECFALKPLLSALANINVSPEHQVSNEHENPLSSQEIQNLKQDQEITSLPIQKNKCLPPSTPPPQRQKEREWGRGLQALEEIGSGDNLREVYDIKTN